LEIRELLNDVISALNLSVLEGNIGYTSGSTALIVIVDPDHECVHIANVGDSRCVLYYKDGHAEETKDHKPMAEIERL